MKRYTIEIDCYPALENEPFPDFYTAFADAMDRYIEFRHVHDVDLSPDDIDGGLLGLEEEVRRGRGFKIIMKVE